MGASKQPEALDPADAYREGVETDLKYAPQLAAGEYKLRGKYDDLGVESNLARSEKYGGRALDTYARRLGEVDPEGVATRTELGRSVLRDLRRGTKLTSPQRRQATQTVRAAQVARGNTMGNSAVSAEALYVGGAGDRMYQQRLQNAGSFLASDDVLQDLTSIAGITTAASTPDRGFSYINRGAGAEGQASALQYYQQALSGGAGGGSKNWWQRALNGAGQGASVGGFYGALGGAVDGAANGPIYKGVNGG